MDGDLFAAVCRRIGELEGHLAESGDPVTGRDTVRTILHELNGIVDELQRRETMLLALRRADETERRRARSAGEDRFETTFAHAPIGMALVGRDARTFHVNRALCEMFGYSEEEVLSGSVVDIAGAEEMQQSAAAAQQLLSGERRSYELEKRFRHKDGRIVEALLSISLVGARAEQSPYFICQLIDISERKRAEAALRASEERFRALIENALDVVSLLDADGRLLYNTPNVARVFGYDARNAIGRVALLEGVHREDVQRASELFLEALHSPGRPVTTELRVRRADGAWLWVEGTACNMLDNPHVQAIVVNARDVTERRRAEEAYHSLVEHSLQGLVISRDGRIVFANHAITTMLGYSAAELAAMSAQQVNALVHRDDRVAVGHHLSAVSAGEPVPGVVEFRAQRADGAIRWLALSASQAEYDGRPALQVATIDVTDRKLAEDAARQRQAELAHVLRVHTMGEVAAGLAHEINQPLSAIVNYARGCVWRLEQLSAPAEVLEALEGIAAEALRAGGIVRGLRQFLRKEPPRHAWEDLNALVTDAVRLSEAEARQHGVVITSDLCAAVPLVQVDRVQIEQVIVNLIRNGLEAIAGGNGSHRELSIGTAVADEQSIAVAVRDSGSGLAAEVAERIFEPFFTTKRNGLGMGLSISRSIVHAHGGRIWAAPNAEGGTTISFSIPLRAPAEQEAPVT